MSDHPDPRIHDPETGERCRYQVLRHEITRCPLFKNYHGDFAVLINILSWLDPKTDVSRVSIRQLQEGTGLCRNAVRSALRRLIGVQLIERLKTTGRVREYAVKWSHPWCYGSYVQNETYFKHYPLNAADLAAKRTEAARKGGESLKVKRENKKEGESDISVKQDELNQQRDRGIRDAPVNGVDKGIRDDSPTGAWSASMKGIQEAFEKGIPDDLGKGVPEDSPKGIQYAHTNYFEVTNEVNRSKASSKVAKEEEELTAQHTRSSDCGDGDDGDCAKRAAHDLSAPSELIVHTPSGEAIASIDRENNDLQEFLWAMKLSEAIEQRFGKQDTALDQKLRYEVRREEQGLFERSLAKIASVLVKKGHGLIRLFEKVNGQPFWKASLNQEPGNGRKE